MSQPPTSQALQSLIACGTKLWLDSIDPDLVVENRKQGATGATSNPIIIADLIKTGRFDRQIQALISSGKSDEEIAWETTNRLVAAAQEVFEPVWRETVGDDGYVSFELDPLIEDPASSLPHEQRVSQYIELGQRWSRDHKNRMIKVPATAAGLDSLESLAAAGVPLNVTLIFSQRQHQQACEAIWRGAQRQTGLDLFKSVYSIFVSRIDVYTAKQCPQLSAQAQGVVGIVNAQRIWENNRVYWSDKNCPLAQEIVFASTGTKRPEDPPAKYVAALAGSGIQTNPPATNAAVADSDLQFRPTVEVRQSDDVLSEIDRLVDFEHLENTLMSEGIAKFADPHKALLNLIGQHRTSLAGA